MEAHETPAVPLGLQVGKAVGAPGVLLPVRCASPNKTSSPQPGGAGWCFGHTGCLFGPSIQAGQAEAVQPWGGLCVCVDQTCWRIVRLAGVSMRLQGVWGFFLTHGQLGFKQKFEQTIGMPQLSEPRKQQVSLKSPQPII